MAKNQTSFQRTVADNIRGEVGNIIAKNANAETRKTVVNNHISTLPSSAAQKNSKLLQASAAMYRATRDSAFKPDQTQIKDYAAAIEIIAEKRGLTPQKDGRYSKEQFEKELSPKEMMKVFAAQTLQDMEDENAARSQINADLQKAYDNPEKLPEELEEIKNVSANQASFHTMTDAEFLDMNEEKQQEYLAGLNDLDKERLEKLLSDNENKKAEDLAKKAGRVDGFMDDPDWGHKKDDDNFKIEQGDIIEYLMKDIVLASAAWAGNKAAGFAGIVIYEIGRGTHRNILRPGWKKVKEEWKKGKESWEKTQKALFGEEANEETKEVFDYIAQKHEAAIASNSQAIKAHSSNDPRKDTLYHYYERIIANQVIIGEDRLIDAGSTSKTFAEIMPHDPASCKEAFTVFRDNIQTEQKNYLSNKYPGEETQINDWFAYEEAYIKTKGNSSVEKPESKYADDLTDIRAAQIARQNLLPQQRIFEAQLNLFAENYSMYKFLEFSRKDPKNKVLTDKTEADKFIEQAKLEADLIFLTAEKQRREGKNVLSREQLIKESENLKNTSQECINNKQKKSVKDDKLRAIIGEKPVTEENKEELMSECQNLDPHERYAAEMLDINAREKELGCQSEDINRRRKLLEETKNKVNKTLNVDISKKYTPIKNRSGER